MGALCQIFTRKYIIVSGASLATAIGKVFLFFALTKMEATSVSVYVVVSGILVMTLVNAVVLKGTRDLTDILTPLALVGGSFSYVWHVSALGVDFNLLDVSMVVGGTLIGCAGDVILEAGGRRIQKPDHSILKNKLILVSYEVYKTFWYFVIACITDAQFYSSSRWLPFSLVPAIVLAIYTASTNVTKVVFGSHVVNTLFPLVLPMSYVFEVIWLLPRKFMVLEVLHICLVLLGAILSTVFVGQRRYRVAWERQSVLRRLEREACRMLDQEAL